MYRNLRAEMAREGIDYEDIAKALGVSQSTVSRKMNGQGKFFYDETLAIRNKFFPDCTLEYLFEKNEQLITA